MFAAYAHMDVGSGLMAQTDGVFHQAAGALDVEFLERIRLVDLPVQISGQEFAGWETYKSSRLTPSFFA